MSSIYEYLTKDLYKITSNSDGSSSMVVGGTGVTNADSLISGEVDGNISFTGGYIQSYNYVSGTSGWRLAADGTLRAVNAVLSGTITATAGQIGGTTISSTALTGGIIQTASSGQRIVMASSDNTLRFYDATGQVIGIGTTSAVAMVVALNATTTNGVRINAAQANDIGFEYNASGNYDSTGVNVQLTGATGTGTAVNINHDGSGGEGIYIDLSAGARGLQIANTGSGIPIYITNSGAESMFISHSHDGSIGVEIDYSGRQQALYVSGSDANSTNAVMYATSGQADGTETVKFNKTDYGAVLYLVSSHSSNNNYSTGIKMNIASSGTSVELAFEFAGSEYIASATSVSGLTGVVKVLTSDGVCYLPVYSGYA